MMLEVNSYVNTFFFQFWIKSQQMNGVIVITIPDPLLYLLRFQNLITEDTSHILRILRDINLTLT